ncbi:CoxG family protein [Pseudonocardia sp. N23]|uniref:CoxG family protein n=1 Tax=Pseudonocardia sp. N23 TaxID=1987376 RepID=UPI000BFBEA24|nr:SRPBCC domain-containing protein [Pseudonocardia sp. N23]GAY11486.1 carbon monoxide oxidation accessory protein CoxG [Pseudonocardia sp. N23]
MKLTSSFRVPAPPDQVFAHFLDPDSMRVCVPGCEELERPDPGHYRGRLVNEIAHVRFSAGFTADITEAAEVTDSGDPAQVRAVLRGEDLRLGSSIKVDARLGVRPAAGDAAASDVDWDLEITLWGKLGRLGESIVGRRSREVERQFVERFTAVCAAGPPGRGNAEVRAHVGAPAVSRDAAVPVAAAAVPARPVTRVVPRPAAATTGTAGAATVVASRHRPVTPVPEIVPVPAARPRPAARIAALRVRATDLGARTRVGVTDVGGRVAEHAARWVVDRGTRFLEHRRGSAPSDHAGAAR